MENLSKKEMIEIGGGGLFDSNSSSISISFTSSTDSLLNLTFERTYGDYHGITTISAGNDIDLNLGLTSKQ